LDPPFLDEPDVRADRDRHRESPPPEYHGPERLSPGAYGCERYRV